MVGPSASIRSATSAIPTSIPQYPTVQSQCNPIHSVPSPRYTTPPIGAPPEKLVPLEYLQNVSPPRRDPVDEQLLRRLASVSRPRLDSSPFSVYRSSA